MKPATVPEPEHHHLPSWVRRTFAKARPILADLLGSLEGEPQQQYADDINELTARISAGKFSQAFQYPQLIASGLERYERQRDELAEAARARRALETARRRVSERLRDAGAQLPAEVTSRLNKELRAATDMESIGAVEAATRQAIEGARAHEERRRDREIHRTKSRIARSAPKNATSNDGTESWQDVLRRLQEQLSAAEAGGGR